MKGPCWKYIIGSTAYLSWSELYSHATCEMVLHVLTVQANVQFAHSYFFINARCHMANATSVLKVNGNSYNASSTYCGKFLFFSTSHYVLLA